MIAVAVALIAGALGAALGSSSSDDSGSETVATRDDENDGDADESDAPGASEDSATTATTTAPAAEPSTSSTLEVVGTVTIPEGTRGELDVVILGTLDPASGTIPVVVRNNTSSPAHRLEVTGTARGPDGSLAGSGSSQGFEPATVEPGEWAFGYVFFSGAVPDEAEFDLAILGSNQ